MRSCSARWISIAIGLVAVLAAGEPSTAAPATRADRSAPPASARRAAAAALPDTVLAQVGPRRRISIADFQRSWKQVSPPARPDSLTPQGAQEFLRLLVGKEVLAEAALRTTWVWTRAESARFNTLRDRLTLEAALAEPLAQARADLGRAGTRKAAEQLVGRAARDSAVARMQVSFDEKLVGRLTRAFAALPKPSRDSGLFAQLRVLGRLPATDPGDSLAAVARTAEGDYRVRDLLEWWKMLNPLARPRVETPEQMRDVVKNGLFERKLRRFAATLDLQHRADIAAALDREIEYIAVSHLVQREVYDSLTPDSLTLRTFYDRHRDEYRIPARVRALRLELPDRADAGRMAARLRDPAEAESLGAASERQRLGYTADLTAERDSALFAQGMRAGAGTVVGPDSVSGGWAVARVIALLPPEERSFEQARTLVEHHWYGVEGERRMVELIERLRRSTRVVVNERALGRLGAS